jgi:ribosome maturation factor RimP
MRARERQLQELLEPAVQVLGYELVGVQFVTQGHSSVLRIYIDSGTGITVDDCERVSYQVSGVLDVEDPIHSRYTLEVSSPGLDRPLFTPEHFQRFVGHLTTVKMDVPLDGRRKFRGELSGYRDGMVLVREEDVVHSLPYDMISIARLVPEY